LERLSAFCAIALLALAPACRCQRQQISARGNESGASSARAVVAALDVLCVASVEPAIRKAGEGFRAAESADVHV